MGAVILSDLGRSAVLDALCIDAETVAIVMGKLGEIWAMAKLPLRCQGLAEWLAKLLVFMAASVKYSGETAGIKSNGINVSSVRFKTWSPLAYPLLRCLCTNDLPLQSLNRVILPLQTIMFVLFISSGKYPDLQHFILGFELGRTKDGSSFQNEYITRRLLWEQFSELARRIEITKWLQSLSIKGQKDDFASAGKDVYSCVGCRASDVPVLFVGDFCHHTHCYACLAVQQTCCSCQTKAGPFHRIAQ